MECKLCFKRFSNGKALGGHMRSHFATLPLPPKTPQRQELSEPLTESSSSILSGDERESSGERSSFLSGTYGLREKPKRSFRVADPDFCDAVMDPESKTESTRVRCKRAKGMSELEMEEEVALCLIMLSKDVGRRSESDELTQLGKVYKCENCDRVFKSSQGLGSHRAHHHDNKITNLSDGVSEKRSGKSENVVKEQVPHECIVCGKVFRSAQALGGHKRSHVLAARLGTRLVEDHGSGGAAIDLNLPAEIEGEEEELDGLCC